MWRIATESATSGCDISSIEEGRFEVLHRAGTALLETAGSVVGIHELPQLANLRVPEVKKIADVAGLQVIIADGRANTDGRTPGDGWSVTTEPTTATANRITVTAIPHSEAVPVSTPSDTRVGRSVPPDARGCAFPGNASRATLDKYWQRLRTLLPRDSKVIWFAGAMNLDALATEDTLYLFSSEGITDREEFEHEIRFSQIRRVEIGKEWFDWFVRVHLFNSSSVRFNLGGNHELAEDLQSRLDTVRTRSERTRPR
jgi:hypothetical protein